MSLVPVIDQLPPVVKEEYVNLMLEKTVPEPRKTIDLKEIFPDELSSQDRHVVLIQGYPSSGKSTLAVKVCKEWANQCLLKDVELLCLVRLKQFLNKENLRLDDILFNQPVTNVNVINEVTQLNGRGVCFIFDGLDEYEPHLVQGNLIFDIISGHKLHLANVFVTSRPTKSTRIVNWSQKVEIIGIDDQEIDRCVKKRYESDATGRKASEVLSYLKVIPTLLKCAHLFLTLLYSCTYTCLLYTSPSPRDATLSRMPSSA